MKRTLGLLGSLTVAGLGVLAISAPAHAVTDEVPTCVSGTTKSFEAPVTNWKDRGASYNYWALKAMTRTFNVCTITTPDTGDWTYKAVVQDNGKFTTLAGDTPAGKSGLVAGIKGNVTGGFTVEFKAPKVLAFSTAGLNPDTYLENSDWVKTVFTGATLTDFRDYKWTYTTACESFTDNNDKYTGDITKLCAVPTTPPATKPPTSEPKKCEAYVYYGSTISLCDRFDTVRGKLSCKQVGYKVKLVNANNDPWGLDGYRGVKGIGCEAYPTRVFNTPSPTHTTTPPVAGGGNDNGGLPVTGDKVKTIGVIGGVLLVGGVIATVVTRRRKARFVA